IAVENISLLIQNSSPGYDAPNISTSRLLHLRSLILAGKNEGTEYIRELWMAISPKSSNEIAQVFYSIKNVLDGPAKGLQSEHLHKSLSLNYNELFSSDEALAHILHYASEILEQIRTERSTDNPLIDLIATYMEENYMDASLSGRMISERFNLSEKYFYTLFKDVKGISYSDFLTGIRLRHASRILQKTNKKMSDIAYSVGFNSSDTFSKAFKRTYGVSPGKYRHLHLEYRE
ncbi:MAG: helix-turn-helix transcriptional regulator, partial [Gallicola sp.]|nr:helix-turn-helix transcriptional regulator [Gallicola sp.]